MDLDGIDERLELCPQRLRVEQAEGQDPAVDDSEGQPPRGREFAQRQERLEHIRVGDRKPLLARVLGERRCVLVRVGREVGGVQRADTRPDDDAWALAALRERGQQRTQHARLVGAAGPAAG